MTFQIVLQENKKSQTLHLDLILLIPKGESCFTFFCITQHNPQDKQYKNSTIFFSMSSVTWVTLIRPCGSPLWLTIIKHQSHIQEQQLYFMPDIPRLGENLQSALLCGEVFIIPKDNVGKKILSHNKVSVVPFKVLLTFQDEMH